MQAMDGELILKMLREAGIALGSDSVNGSYSMWFAVWDYLQNVRFRNTRSFQASSIYVTTANILGKPFSKFLIVN